MPNNINLYFIINKEQIVFCYILFDLVLFDIRYWQQVSDIDPADAAVAVQRRTTLRRLVHFIMTFISYGSSQEIHISGSGEPGIYTRNETMI